jgi:hypothetical protein
LLTRLPRSSVQWNLSGLMAILLIVLVSGCIVIPTPEVDSGSARANLNKESPAQLQPGVTTIEDVLLTFGEPDAVSPDERTLVYRSEKDVALWIIAGGYSAAGGTFTKDRYLLVELDQKGVVQNREFSTQWFSPLSPDKLLETKGRLEAGVASADETAVISGQAFWYPNTEGFKTLSLGPEQYSRGYLVLTAGALQFRDRTQLGNAPPRWLLPYETLTECRIAKFVLGRRVVIRTRDNQVHSFNFVSGASTDKKKTEAAGEFIQTRITGGDRSGSLQTRP